VLSSKASVSGPAIIEEGQSTKLIEQYKSRFPSGLYLGLALGSMGLSLMLQLKKQEHDALSFGQWVPTSLLMGM